MEEGVSSAELADEIGVHHERVRRWIRRGYIKASCYRAYGRGVSSVFTKRDVSKVKAFKNLVDLGMSRDLAVRALEMGSVPFTLLILGKMEGGVNGRGEEL